MAAMPPWQPAKARCLVYDGESVLLGQSPSGVWGLPGGALEDGEGALVAALRELEEETGLTVDDVNAITFCWIDDDVAVLGVSVRRVEQRLNAAADPDGEFGALQFFEANALPTPLYADAEGWVRRWRAPLTLAAGEAEDAEAVYQEGFALLHGGVGISIDKGAARARLQRAAELGHQAALGKCLYEGWGVEKSLDQAEATLRAAAVAGHLGAMNSVGWILWNDRGDGEAARPWFEAAAMGGDVRAQCNLGRWYQRSGALLAAARCFDLAAAQGQASAVGLAAGARAMTVPVGRVNMDGIEGSSIPAGLHAARYGGGDDYRQVEPLLSVVTALPAFRAHYWPQLRASLAATTTESLKLVHGFSDVALLPGGAPPVAEVQQWDACHLLVTQLPEPAADGASYASLMLHGWLFPGFHASGRKAHKKFPLLALFGCDNVAPAPTAERALPAWLPVDGAFSWADQHVHKDEPVDLGGFTFCEVYFGSDMARVAPADVTAPMTLWAAAVDTEARRGLLTLCVCLPYHAAVVESVRDAGTLPELAAALRQQWGVAGEAAALAVASMYDVVR